MHHLLFWNKTKYAATLSATFGSENVITGDEDFLAVTKQLDKYSSLIVLCELEWSGNGASTTLHKLRGIDMVKDLRRIHNLNIPVLFVSFVPFAKILNAEREILTAIGHDFLQLPTVPKDFITFINREFGNQGKIRSLSVMELNDIKSFYCSKEGILNQELHSLDHFFDLNITPETHDSIFAELQNSICKIYDLFLMDSTIALATFKTGYNSLTKENISDAVNHIVRLGNYLLKNFGDKTYGNASENKSAEQYSWKVLLLDDQINEQHELVQLMKVNNINVICIDNTTEAKNILLDDWKSENRIMVVIADYRLYENILGIKRHQKIQGYQFLKDIATTDHLVRLVAFSGLPRKFLLNSFKHYNIRTEVKSKKDYLSSEITRQIFCDEIKELAEDNLEAIEAMPCKNEGFKSTLQTAYILFRSSPSYTKIESNISRESTSLVELLKEDNFKTPLNLEFITSTFENNKKAKAQKKEIIKCSECGSIIMSDNVSKQSDGKKLPEKYLKNPDAYFKRFQPYLIARRVALWMYVAGKKGLIPAIETRMMAELLTGKGYVTQKEKYSKKSDGAYRQIFSTNLGIKFEDFPTNITIEERRWLHYDMQLPIFNDLNLINPVFNKIAKIYKDFISSDIFFKENIKKNKFSFSHKYKQGNYIIDFASDFTPKIKTVTDARVLFLLIADHIKEDKRKLDLIKSLVSRLRISLFESRDKVIYLKNLFQYFNAIYGILNREQTYLSNSPSKIKVKSNFTDKSKHTINKVFDRAFELLLNHSLPNEGDLADVFSVFITGEDIVAKLGSKILVDKANFYYELTKAINNENSFLGVSLDEGFGHARSLNKISEPDDFSEFLDNEDFFN